MDAAPMAPRMQELLYHISLLPYEINQKYEQVKPDVITAWTLYQLSSPDCCNFCKAVFVLNNPDFLLCQGVAAYAAHLGKAKQVCCEDHAFDDVEIHQKARTFTRPYFAQIDKTVQAISDEFSLANPHYCQIPMRFGNVGVLVYEYEKDSFDSHVDRIVEKLAGVLAFCPLAVQY